TSDEVIYLVLAVMLVVVRSSNVAESVKNGFRRLATVMLKKKRLNTDETELSRLMRGEAPIPNSGRIDDLYKYLNAAACNIVITAKPLKLWLEICLALDRNL